jgi:alkylation response protein AidB-like acyl-CoA dehydrogenase
METVDRFRERSRQWLEQNASPRPPSVEAWGVGSDSVALNRNMSLEDEVAHIDRCRKWIQRKADAGFENLTWEVEWGGQGLSRAHEQAFAEEERHFAVPQGHAAINVTRFLVAPTIRAAGTPAQRDRFVRPMLRAEELWCQLFSEPGAGSDLAGMMTSADREGDEWVLNGQKVWTSGARFADWGYIQCRTDRTAPKHKGLTAFLLRMDSPGVEVRPLKQMTGGSSFYEVFLTDVRVPDSCRLGACGDGWRVAITTLGFERSSSTDDGARAVRMLFALARHVGRSDDPVVRQLLAHAYTRQQLHVWSGARTRAALRRGETPGPEGSIGKLFWTETLRAFNDAASELLGPRLIADTGEWGMYSWAEHLLGTPGARIAAGTDEIQRNILGERALGLPGEPRHDK